MSEQEIATEEDPSYEQAIAEHLGRASDLILEAAGLARVASSMARDQAKELSQSEDANRYEMASLIRTAGNLYENADYLRDLSLTILAGAKEGEALRTEPLPELHERLRERYDKIELPKAKGS